jgi:hypothetical protein
MLYGHHTQYTDSLQWSKTGILPEHPKGVNSIHHSGWHLWLERLKFLTPPAGFEPATRRLTVVGSTAELQRIVFLTNMVYKEQSSLVEDICLRESFYHNHYTLLPTFSFCAILLLCFEIKFIVSFFHFIESIHIIFKSHIFT